MKTITIIAGIVLVGATVITLVQNDKKKDESPEIHNAAEGHAADAVTPVAGTPQLNPAHGVAGHRCDLPVGAPLSTASGTTTPVQTPQIINPSQGPRQPVSASPASSPTATPTGIKINPAHGLPGHRCDLQVGAPLS